MKALSWLTLCLMAAGPAAVMAVPPPPAVPPAIAASAPANAPVNAPVNASFSLRWAVERNTFPPESPDARSRARFTLTLPAAQALPAHGWALYFNCIAGVVTGPVDGHLVLEQVTGTLYRLRPGTGFTGVAAGQSLQVGFFHPELMFKADKAPQGPYLVFDADADRGLAIVDYRAETPMRPEQLTRAAGQPPARVSAEEIFERNAATRALPAEDLPPVFPTPQRLQLLEGRLRWSGLPRIEAASALQREAALALEFLRPHFKPAQPARGMPGVTLRMRPLPGHDSPEAYVLDISPGGGVVITGASAAGVAHGLQSLRDLLPLQATAAGIDLPALRISDAPRFEHRGLMLDVARNFHPKATVLRLLDLMARLKLNKLHLHLTDDEGWRLAIPGLPELTEVGGRRGHSADAHRHLPPAYGSGPDVANPDGSGHYSADDYIQILRHAAARHIEVIPEIEMPGHARAAVKAMEARSHRLKAAGDPQADEFRLNDPGDRSVYRSAQVYTDNVMDPGLESTYRFIAHVVAEMVRLHRIAGVPLRQLHVGADETPAGAWTKSPAAQALVAQRSLAGTQGLWNHFYDRVGVILRAYGLAAGGWEELGSRRAHADGSGPLVPNEHFQGRGHTLYVWNNLDDADDLAYRLANAGWRTVLAPATALYFDMAANRDPEEPGVNWAAYVDLDTVFNLVPFDQLRTHPAEPAKKAGKTALSEAGRRHIAGLEATLFSETLRGAERLEFQLLPRVFGLAERAWAPDPAWAREADTKRARALHAQAWSVFANQVGKQLLPRLDRDLPGLRPRLAPPGLKRAGDSVRVNHQLPGLTLRYTTDGSAPTAASAIADGPVRTSGPVRAAAFDARGRRGPITTLEASSTGTPP